MVCWVLLLFGDLFVFGLGFFFLFGFSVCCLVVGFFCLLSSFSTKLYLGKEAEEH